MVIWLWKLGRTDRGFPIFRSVRKIAKTTISFVMFVRLSARNKSAPTRRIFMKFDIWRFFGTPSRKFKFHQSRTRIKDTLHEDQDTFFLIIPRSFLLRMRNASDKRCRENSNMHFVFSFFFENGAVYQTMLKIL